MNRNQFSFIVIMILLCTVFLSVVPADQNLTDTSSSNSPSATQQPNRNRSTYWHLFMLGFAPVLLDKGADYIKDAKFSPGAFYLAMAVLLGSGAQLWHFFSFLKQFKIAKSDEQSQGSKNQSL